ncbi:hypothetical protein N8I77_004163 [Diaporthe amygdali]|uniref:Anthrone oxygenase encC n=1 Tax=Phomopsis amygdali TaxID=1214568 RepID=A0AAD9W5P1_PHOAM|nr:hypothetical protein N8I77_004163 [Diaporthe amygdali]
MDSTTFTRIPWTKLVQLIGLAGACHMSGYGTAHDRVGMHNLLNIRDRDAITRGWFRAWDFGRRYGPYMTLGPAILHGFLAWQGWENQPAAAFNLAASIFLGAIGPHSFIIVFPTNDKMLAEHERLINSEGKKADDAQRASIDSVRQWCIDWRAADLQRTVLAHLGALCSIAATLLS